MSPPLLRGPRFIWRGIERGEGAILPREMRGGGGNGRRVGGQTPDFWAGLDDYIIAALSPRRETSRALLLEVMANTYGAGCVPRPVERHLDRLITEGRVRRVRRGSYLLC